MIDFNTAVWISIGLIVYYTIFQVFSDFIRAGMTHNTPNQLISELRTTYKASIKTFQKNNSLLGFAWHKTIYINENLFKRKKQLLFVFHHEHFHLKHHHKAWTLLMRFTLSLFPLLLSIIHWSLFIIIFLGSALLIEHISKIFEREANGHATKMTTNEFTKNKGEDGSR